MLASLAPALRLARTVTGRDSSLAAATRCLAVITSLQESIELTILKIPETLATQSCKRQLLDGEKERGSPACGVQRGGREAAALSQNICRLVNQLERIIVYLK